MGTTENPQRPDCHIVSNDTGQVLIHTHGAHRVDRYSFTMFGPQAQPLMRPAEKNALREWLLRAVKIKPLVIAYENAPNAFLPLLRAILGKSGLKAGYDMSKAGQKSSTIGIFCPDCKNMTLMKLHFAGWKGMLSANHIPR